MKEKLIRTQNAKREKVDNCSHLKITFISHQAPVSSESLFPAQKPDRQRPLPKLLEQVLPPERGRASPVNLILEVLSPGDTEWLPRSLPSVLHLASHF